MTGIDSSRVLLKQSTTGLGGQPPAYNPQSLRAQGGSEARRAGLPGEVQVLQPHQMRLSLLSLSKSLPVPQACSCSVCWKMGAIGQRLRSDMREG